MNKWMPLLIIGGVGALIYFMMRGRAQAQEEAKILPIGEAQIRTTQEIIGGTPGSAGYQWDPDRGGWIRPWDTKSFIPMADKPEWYEYSPVTEIVRGAQIEAGRQCSAGMTSGEFIAQVLLPSGVLTDADVALFARPVTDLGSEIYEAQKRRLAEIEQQLGTETSLGEIRNATGKIKKGMYPASSSTTTTEKTTTTRAGLAAIKEAAGW